MAKCHMCVLGLIILCPFFKGKEIHISSTKLIVLYCTIILSFIICYYNSLFRGIKRGKSLFEHQLFILEAICVVISIIVSVRTVFFVNAIILDTVAHAETWCIFIFILSVCW